jgi:hypothetical protein
MPHSNRWMVVVLVAGLPLVACHRGSDKATKIQPARVEHIDGTAFSRVTLTPKAAERLDIKTGTVREVTMTRSASVRPAVVNGSRALRKVVPYAAVLYDASGNTWVYTSPDNLVFVRHAIKVDYIDGEQAVLLDGPPVGTKVVTVGGAELFGAEFEIGH